MKSALNKSEEYEKYYQLLGNSGSERLFLTMKDVFMLALTIGFTEKNKKSFSKPGGEPIKLSIFDEHDKNIMDIVALGENNDLSLLTKEHEDDKYDLIEEYANGGMEILANNFCKPLPSFDNLKKFVLSYEKGTTETKKEDYTDFILDAVNEVNKL